MKKAIIVLVVALTAGGVLAAQTAPWGPQGRNQADGQGQTVKVDGKLALINGMIGLKSGNKTYYTPRLGRLAGFVEGIKEGASVKLEGYERQFPAAPEYSMLMVTKATVEGKDYDLGQAGGACGFGNGGGRGPGGAGKGGMMRGGRW